MTPRVLYIAGTGRSGSTLLSSLVGDRDGFVAAGELRFIWRRGFIENHLCECGEPFRSCPFWRAVVERAFGGMDGIDTQNVVELLARVDRIRYIPRLARPALRPMRFRRDVEMLENALRRLYSAILSVSGASVVVDSSKDPSYAYLLCGLAAFDVAVVHLVRDSRAVAYSWTRQRLRPEVHWRVEYMRQRSPFLTARRWDQYQLMFEVLTRLVPRSVRIRYEDLVHAPEATVDRVAALVPEAEGTGTAGHSLSGNPMRFEGRVDVAPDTEWVNGMASDDRRLVTAVTAPLLYRYGYVGRRAGAQGP